MKKTGANVKKVKLNTEIVIILTVFVMFWEVNVKKSRKKTLFSQILALLSKSVCHQISQSVGRSSYSRVLVFASPIFLIKSYILERFYASCIFFVHPSVVFFFSRKVAMTSKLNNSSSIGQIWTCNCIFY